MTPTDPLPRTDPQSQTGEATEPPSDGDADVRSGGRPEAAAEQLEHAADPVDYELAGSPDPRDEAGGQDSGSID